MKVGEEVITESGYVGMLVQLCGDGCARVMINGIGLATYPVSKLKVRPTREMMDEVYYAALALHRMRAQDGVLVYKLNDAKHRLFEACEAVK